MARARLWRCVILAVSGLAFAAATGSGAAEIPVGTWDFPVVTVRATVCARGRCKSTRETTNAILLVHAGGTYRSPNALPSCPLPDEVGTWKAIPRGRFRFTPTNIGDLFDAISSCNGVSIRAHGASSGILKPLADGVHANYRLTLRGGGRYRGVSFTYTGVAHGAGTRTDSTEPAVRDGSAAGTARSPAAALALALP